MIQNPFFSISTKNSISISISSLQYLNIKNSILTSSQYSKSDHSIYCNPCSGRPRGPRCRLWGEWWPDLPSRQTTGHYFQCYHGCLFSPHQGATEPHPWRTVQTRRYFCPYLERWSPSCFRRHRDIPAAVISSPSCGGDPLAVETLGVGPL